MIHKKLLFLFMAFAMATNFCLAHENPPSLVSQDAQQSALEDAVITLDLTKHGHYVTLVGDQQEIALQKGQHLIVNINGDAISHYQLSYEVPTTADLVSEQIPSIYYQLSDPWSQVGWYEWSHWIPVLQEERKLNTVDDHSMSFHFIASDSGIKEITVGVFDDTGHLITNPVYSTSFAIVATFKLTVIVK